MSEPLENEAWRHFDRTEHTAQHDKAREDGWPAANDRRDVYFANCSHRVRIHWPAKYATATSGETETALAQSHLLVWGRYILRDAKTSSGANTSKSSWIIARTFSDANETQMLAQALIDGLDISEVDEWMAP